MFAQAEHFRQQGFAPLKEERPSVVLVFGSPALLFHPMQILPRRSTLKSTGVVSTGVSAEETATASIEAVSLKPELTGRMLGGCRIDRMLGQGCMGQVYKGHHPMLDRPVAIKVLPPSLAESEERRARLRQEARIAAALRHPNIVQIYDFGEVGGLMYLIMEYIDGTNLKGRLSQLRRVGEIMALGEAVGIAAQLARALAYAHGQGAIHRDLKPANVLLTEADQAILVDFGLALMRGGTRLTAPGTVWGSPTYIAPEQLGETPQVDARSDLYSLGVVLYEMVTGRPPFKADSIVETLWQQAKVPPCPPRELAPDVPKELETIILRTLAKQPHDRFGNAQELADALSAVGILSGESRLLRTPCWENNSQGHPTWASCEIPTTEHCIRSE
jgi:serine/threonine protein kinase